MGRRTTRVVDRLGFMRVDDPNDAYLLFPHSIHIYENCNGVDADEENYEYDDDDSDTEGDDLMYEYMANATRANFARYGSRMPPDHLNPFFMD